jgi:hypothetical protein
MSGSFLTGPPREAEKGGQGRSVDLPPFIKGDRGGFLLAAGCYLFPHALTHFFLIRRLITIKRHLTFSMSGEKVSCYA